MRTSFVLEQLIDRTIPHCNQASRGIYSLIDGELLDFSVHMRNLSSEIFEGHGAIAELHFETG